MANIQLQPIKVQVSEARSLTRILRLSKEYYTGLTGSSKRPYFMYEIK